LKTYHGSASLNPAALRHFDPANVGNQLISFGSRSSCDCEFSVV
jgi:hypothetical protein